MCHVAVDTWLFASSTRRHQNYVFPCSIHPSITRCSLSPSLLRSLAPSLKPWTPSPVPSPLDALPSVGRVSDPPFFSTAPPTPIPLSRDQVGYHLCTFSLQRGSIGCQLQTVMLPNCPFVTSVQFAPLNFAVLIGYGRCQSPEPNNGNGYAVLRCIKLSTCKQERLRTEVSSASASMDNS